jgi:nicotinate-nucleotide adenylyltransferase
MRLAIFGGTFDPIHNAHLEIARAALSHFRLDRVLFVPAARPPHKGGVTVAGFDDRVRMAELAVADEPRFAVSRLEEGTRRSYSIDTIEKLRVTLGASDELFFLIGADAFAEIQSWHRWQDVARQVVFLVISRPGHSYAGTSTHRPPSAGLLGCSRWPARPTFEDLQLAQHRRRTAGTRARRSPTPDLQLEDRRAVEAAEDLLEGVVVAFAVAAGQIGIGRAASLSRDGSLMMISLGVLRWPIHKLVGALLVPGHAALLP